ncbi:hypothetical protein OUZ56_002174 [Daphnia magna]|uniref:Uncharacterized protein n=1 Tax=Daphnia magna TaxID=35525 RepID=A0ABR0A4W6_9CRUS|nr:hypothetical protein OUZ56_002174 [Daphnia magna]
MDETGETEESLLTCLGKRLRRVTYGSDTTYRTVVALSRIVGNPAMYNYAQGQPKWRAMGSGRGRLRAYKKTARGTKKHREFQFKG